MLIRYTEWILKWRYLVTLVSIACVLVVAAGANNLFFNGDYRVFFSKENPQLTAFENLQNTYTKDDNVLIVITPKNKAVFSVSTLGAVKNITEAAWQVPYSIRVDSVTNFQHSYAEQDSVFVSDLIDEPITMTADDLAYAKAVALAEPILINRLVSPNTQYTGVNITIQLPGVNEITEVPEVVKFVRQMKIIFLEKYPDIEIRLSGMIMMNNAFPEASQRDAITLVPLAFGFIIVVLFLLLRELSATAAIIILAVFSIFVGIGTAGWLGMVLTPPSAAAPIIILTIAIACAVHILVTMLQEMHKGLTKNNAIIESVRVNFTPIFYTSLTTALGFLCLNFSAAPPFRDLGNISTFGVIGAFILSVTFLPAIMSMLPIKKSQFIIGTGVMAKLGGIVVESRKILAYGLSALSLVFIANIPNNQLNDVFVNYFDESVEFRRDTIYAANNLTGTYTIAYSLDSGEAGGINKPNFLKQVERFSIWYKQQPETIHVSTITDTFKRLNKNMHGDNNSYYKLPETRELAAQYLLFYEMSLPYGLDLNNQIDIDKRTTKVNVTLKTLSSNQTLELEKRANSWLNKNIPNLVTDGASPAIMFANIGKRNISSMLKGTIVGLIIISFVLIFAFGSFKYGLISLIPNLFPAGVAFGIWGVVVGEVGLALSVVTAMTLGIVVDDTVHFISKYIRAKREHNLNSHDAVCYVFNNTGVALWVTSLTLVVGFMVLTFSTFQLNSDLGLMASIIIVIALLLDFLLLPPLLIGIDTVKEPNK